MNLPGHLGYFALALLVGGESLGLLLPGETAILAAGVLARSGRLEIGVVLPVAAAAAIAGDGIGYLLGRRGVRMLLAMRGPLRERRARLVERGEGSTAAPLALDADGELMSAVPALVEDPLHRAAVVRAGRFLGLLSLADVARAVRLQTGTVAP